jgi:tRNA-(ms[2]io[6]A)-hydroxylase
MKPLVVATPAGWAERALRDPGALLLDQLQCEMKATTIALSLIAKNPQLPALVAPMIEVAGEELSHYRMIHELVMRRGCRPEPVTPSPYMSEMRWRAGQGPHHALLDRLLLSALVEARSCERFHLLAHATGDGELSTLFHGLIAAEARHHALYVDLAEGLYPHKQVHRRLAALAVVESTILSELPCGSMLHSGWRDLVPVAAAGPLDRVAPDAID